MEAAAKILPGSAMKNALRRFLTHVPAKCFTASNLFSVFWRWARSIGSVKIGIDRYALICYIRDR
jgi:hypothetical protein